MVENIILERAFNLVVDEDISKISKTRADRLYGSLYTLLIISNRLNLECEGLIHDMLMDMLEVYNHRFSRSKCTK